MIRQAHFMAVVAGIFLIGCAVLLLVVGCAGARSGAPQEKQQGQTEATKKERTRSPQATASEEARCEGTRTYYLYVVISPNGQKKWPVRSGSEEDVKKAGKTKVMDTYTTNDIPGCPSGGLLSGTDEPDKLFGGDGEDKIRGLGGKDAIYGGNGNDVIHAGPGNDNDQVGGFSEYGDDVIYGGDGDDWIMSGGGFGEDIIYGGDGSDNILTSYDHQPDKLYCGKGEDVYLADKHDYVDSSCEVKMGPANA